MHPGLIEKCNEIRVTHKYQLCYPTIDGMTRIGYEDKAVAECQSRFGVEGEWSALADFHWNYQTINVRVVRRLPNVPVNHYSEGDDARGH